MRSSFALGRASALAFVAAFVAVAAGAGAPASSRPAFEIVGERVLPHAVGWVFDVRWLDDDTVAVAAGRHGVFTVPVLDAETPPRPVAGSERLQFAGRLAVSETLLATAFPLGVVGWRARGGRGDWHQDAPLATIVDFDVTADQALFLGARRVDMPGHPRPVWAPEGGILFRSALDRDEIPLSRLMTARSGIDGKAMEMALCGILELGAVRFLSGDRYVVIPGVQPGVFVYAADGDLSRAWSSSSLGIYDDCQVEERQMATLSADLGERLEWWQRHTVLDDLVPWGEWFAAIVRTPRGDGATWAFHPFGTDGPGAVVELPLSAASRGLHVRADTRGDRLAVLLFDYEEEEKLGPPKHRPRLLVLERSKE